MGEEGWSAAALGKLPPHLLVHDVCAAAVSCHFGPQSSGAEVPPGSLPFCLPFQSRELACLSTTVKCAYPPHPLLSPFSHFLLVTLTFFKRIVLFLCLLERSRVYPGFSGSPLLWILFSIFCTVKRIINATWAYIDKHWHSNKKPIHHGKCATNSPTGCITVEHLS